MERTELETLVAQYGEHNATFTALKKTCEAEKDSIKTGLADLGEDKIEAGGYKVTRIVSERQHLDEERMLQIIGKYWSEAGKHDFVCPYIKTTISVDMDALEAAMYRGEIPEDVMQELSTCASTTEVVTLRCSAVKKSKKEADA